MKKRLSQSFIFALLTMTMPLQAFEQQTDKNLTEQQALPLEELRVFAQIFGRIKKDYVESVDDKALLEDAIRGMLSGLDPHSSYLNTEDFEELKEGTTGEFGGLGIEIGSEDGFIKVISPIDDTPAERAGIKAGDLITRIDDKPVKGMTLDDSVNLMRGKPGTKITLTIVRKKQSKPFEIELIRDVIRVKSVKSKIIDEQFAYIRISQFQAATTDDLLKQLNKLKDQLGGQIPGLILDLRNNPGGVLNAAVSVSDAFITDGLIVFTKGMSDGSKMEFKAEPEDVLDGAPIIVLVNEGSASASEIVAGALQDHKRAVIMGRQTFGKGSVQTIVPVTDTVAIKLTTARYYTPLGRSIQAEGIEPDIKIQELDIAGIKQESIKVVKEADLRGHLENGESQDNPDQDKTDDEEPLAQTDYELNEAVNLLKGLTLFR